jgi:hypothetical protein
MKNETLNFPKLNIYWLLLGLFLIISGYVIMGWSTASTLPYEQRVFAWHKLTLAPLVLLTGYLSIVFSIMFRSKK